jgi:hypothetical protein
MQEGGAALRGRTIDVQKRLLCVAVALFGLLLLPSMPVARANDAELITTDETVATQPTRVALVALEEDDDTPAAATTGSLASTVAPLERPGLEWISPDAAQPFCARFDPAPTVRAPPVARRS